MIKTTGTDIWISSNNKIIKLNLCYLEWLWGVLCVRQPTAVRTREAIKSDPVIFRTLGHIPRGHNIIREESGPWDKYSVEDKVTLLEFSGFPCSSYNFWFIDIDIGFEYPLNQWNSRAVVYKFWRDLHQGGLGQVGFIQKLNSLRICFHFY